MIKCRYKFSDVFLQIFFSQVPISCSVIKTDVNSCLKQVILPNNGMEKRLHINTAILISIEFQKCRCAKEMPKLQW